MNLQGSTLKTDIDNVLNHSWSLSIQENVFGNVAFVPSLDTVATVCGPYLVAQGQTRADIEAKQSGITIEGAEITSLLLNQALEYFQKGFGNLSANYILAKKGYKTWSGVTNYYSSYFSVHALLCLQGQTITRIPINGSNVLCHVIALNLPNHVYSVTIYGLNGPEHQKAWKRYYSIYDRYLPSKHQFKVIHTKNNVTDPIEESEFRNTINYAPFRGFVEVGDPASINSFIRMYERNVNASSMTDTLDEYLDTLESLSTDPDFRYFARSVMRLFFIADILKRIADKNADFKAEWDNRINIWQNFTETCIASPPGNNMEAFSQRISSI